MAQNKSEINMPDLLKKGILEAWQTGHGGHPDKVHLLSGEDSLALIIPKALYQAEIDFSSSPTNSTKLLTQYLRTLLDTVSVELQPLVEEFTNKAVEEIVPLVDLRSGWIIAFYRFIKA